MNSAAEKIGYPKPTFGFASRIEAVGNLNLRGYSIEEIARELELPKTNVAAALSAYQRKCLAVSIRCSFNHEHAAYLRSEATRRGTTANRLVVRLIKTISRDDLILAILDDGQ